MGWIHNASIIIALALESDRTEDPKSCLSPSVPFFVQLDFASSSPATTQPLTIREKRDGVI
jgi:hypothetical protein